MFMCHPIQGKNTLMVEAKLNFERWDKSRLGVAQFVMAEIRKIAAI